MNFNNSLKKIICFLLAVLMVLATVGCAGETTKKKKKKKILKKKVIVVTKDEDNKNDNSNKNDDFIIEDVIVDSNNDEEEEEEEEETPRAVRPLPEVAEEKEEYVEPVVPEFDSDYATLNLTNEYVIVYDLKEWDGRYEGKDMAAGGVDKQVTYTANNRIVANKLKTFIKDNYKLNLTVLKETDTAAQAATKKIIVNTNENLKEDQFAVRVDGSNLIFEGGHFAMVEKAEKWFETVEVKEGKVATLKSKNIDFKSTVTLNGKTYDYVWGDEHDGTGIRDDDKWVQAGLNAGGDLVNVFNDEHFNALENGKMRLTGDRYYDESNADIGFAMGGKTETSESMLFRNGYVEFRARLPYADGAWPAIWTMTSGTILDAKVPNAYTDDGYGVYMNRFWDLEFDLFESFADKDHMSTTIHKLYEYVDNYKKAPDGTVTADIIFDFGNGEKINAFEKMVNPTHNIDQSRSTYPYPNTYPDYQWKKYFDNVDTLNNEYHVYSYLYTSDRVTTYVDGEKVLDIEWDPGFDYKDGVDYSRNNNGVGYNLWHYVIYDMALYTPIKDQNSYVTEDQKATSEDLPHNMYVDYVRIYQDLDDTSMSLYCPAAQE